MKLSMQKLFTCKPMRARDIESYDLTSKTIIPFATFGGSGMGRTNEKPAPSCKGAKLLQGRVFKSNVKEANLAAWANGFVY